MAAATDLWESLDGDRDDLTHLSIDGDDPFYRSDFRVGTAAAASVGVSGLAAARLWSLRTGAWQEAHVDLRHAAVAFRSERYLRIDGAPAARIWDELAGYYRGGAGRWIQLHTNFPHHRERALAVLGAAPERAAVEAAVAERDVFQLEQQLADAGACGYALRSPSEWTTHPQHEALGRLPVVAFESLSSGAPEPLPPGQVPLAGVRVLDLTRVIAGPIAGRVLSAYGADVLRVGAAHLPTTELLVIDSGFGKRFTEIDLRDEAQRAHVLGLVREADVVIQAFRPGALDQFGLDPVSLDAVRPGIVTVSLSAWSHAGPWARRRGFDSLVQTASGIAWEGAERAGSDSPVPLPAQALDHASGYILAAAAMSGLHRRATTGGGVHARVALARTGRWIDDLGRVDGARGGDPGAGDVTDLSAEMPSAWGSLSYIRPPGQLSLTPPRWDTPPPRPGEHSAEWLPRD